jgi:hypothetical protein
VGDPALICSADPSGRRVLSTSATHPRRQRSAWSLVALLLQAAAILACACRSPPPIDVRSVQSTGPPIRVFVELANRAPARLDDLYLVLRVFDAGGKQIADSLTNPHEVTGPWIGNVVNEPGAISYQGQRMSGRGSVSIYAIGAGATARFQFDLSTDFAARFGWPARYEVRVHVLRTELPSLPIPRVVLETLSADRHLLVYLCALPLALYLLSRLASLRVVGRPPSRIPRPGLRRLGRSLDLALMLALSAWATTAFLEHAWHFPPGRDPTSAQQAAEAGRVKVMKRSNPALDDGLVAPARQMFSIPRCRSGGGTTQVAPTATSVFIDKRTSGYDGCQYPRRRRPGYRRSPRRKGC